MIKNVIIVLLVCALGLLLWQTKSIEKPEHSETSGIRTLLNEAVSRPGLAGAAVGFCLIDPGGAVLVDHHARTAFIPASSLKTVTTATALEIMGPDFQIETTLCSTAPLMDGLIDGDLMIVGGGDPMLSLADLKQWAQELKKRGL